MITYSPITGSKDTTLLKKIQTEKLIQDWQQGFQIDITNELRGHQEICLYQCNQTKLKFFTPLDIAGSGKLYEKLQHFDWYYMPDKWEHQVALKDFSNCKDILEIGSGSGHFVKLASESGLNVKGIELNEAAVNEARKQHLPIELLDLKDAANLYQGSLDGVCSFQVLEHVSNPKNFIEWSIQMLKPGGKLIYCVPNAESFLRYQDNNLLDMPPHHMFQWSKTAFMALEKLFPIKLESVVIEPLASYHVQFYLDSCSRYFRSTSPMGRIFFNHRTTSLYRQALNLGWRRFVTGHSLYVKFCKLG